METNLNIATINGNLNVGGNVYSKHDTPWQKVTYQNNWVDYDQGYMQVKYRKIHGVVYVQGLMKNGTSSNSLPAFTLPPGFRPNHRMIFTAFTTEGTATQGNRIDVLDAGGVIPFATGATAWFSVNLCFIADQ